MKKKKKRVDQRDVEQIVDAIKTLAHQLDALGQIRDDILALYQSDEGEIPLFGQWAKLQSQQIGQHIRQVGGLRHVMADCFQNILDTGALDAEKLPGNDCVSLKKAEREDLGPDGEVGFESLVNPEYIDS